MRGVNDRNFFNLWQILYRATCPTPTHAHWRVGDVDWRKDRHSFSGADYSVTLEVHHLRRSAASGTRWSLMVAAEHWWDETGHPLKTMNWARVITGDAVSIITWLKGQEKVRLALRGPAEPAGASAG